MAHLHPVSRSSATLAEPRRRTGGRSARVVREVLDATIDALAEVGYGALSFEEVAARAGVSRTTVYRRWPRKPDLVRAALLRMAEEHPAAPDTGALRSDLLAGVRLRLTGATQERDRGLLRVLMAEFGDPELVSLARVVRDRFLQPFTAAVARAVARGELPAGQDPMLILDPILGPVHLNHAVFGDAVEDAYLERLVDLVLAGARAVAARRG
jgi:AcrR family transcriptional regulator